MYKKYIGDSVRVMRHVSIDKEINDILLTKLHLDPLKGHSNTKRDISDKTIYGSDI